jgi:hypothetical protein
MPVQCSLCDHIYVSEEEATAAHKRRRVAVGGLKYSVQLSRDVQFFSAPPEEGCAGLAEHLVPVEQDGALVEAGPVERELAAVDHVNSGGDGRSEAELSELRKMVHTEYKSRNVLPQHKLHPHQVVSGADPLTNGALSERECAFAKVRNGLELHVIGVL